MLTRCAFSIVSVRPTAVCVVLPTSSTVSAITRELISAVQDGLNKLGVEFDRDSRLVRGLDYTGTIFEFTTSQLGTGCYLGRWSL